MRDIERSLKALDSIMRKQAWDIAELQFGLGQTRSLIGQLSQAIETVDLAIASAESRLRFAENAAQLISVDVIQRDRKFLAAKQMELTQLLYERQRAETLEQEFMGKLAELRVQMRVYENLSARRRYTLSADREKAEMHRLDELSLRRVPR